MDDRSRFRCEVVREYHKFRMGDGYIYCEDCGLIRKANKELAADQGKETG